MIKRSVAALSLALVMVPFIGSAASAQDPGVVDSGVVEKVECLFRVYVNEGGESGLDCLS
jgi:hypothetical protein